MKWSSAALCAPGSILRAAYVAVESLRLSRVANHVFADNVIEVGPSDGMANIADLKSAAERLTGSSPVLGTAQRNRPHGWCGLSSLLRDK